jgi:hypothetical protein
MTKDEFISKAYIHLKPIVFQILDPPQPTLIVLRKLDLFSKLSGRSWAKKQLGEETNKRMREREGIEPNRRTSKRTRR